LGILQIVFFFDGYMDVTQTITVKEDKEESVGPNHTTCSPYCIDDLFIEIPPLVSLADITRTPSSSSRRMPQTQTSPRTAMCPFLSCLKQEENELEQNLTEREPEISTGVVQDDPNSTYETSFHTFEASCLTHPMMVSFFKIKIGLFDK